MGSFDQGKPGQAYNVGSEESPSIRSLAERICGLLDCAHGVVILQNAQHCLAAAHFVPDTIRARHELYLPAAMVLNEAIVRSVRWHSSNQVSFA